MACRCWFSILHIVSFLLLPPGWFIVLYSCWVSCLSVWDHRFQLNLKIVSSIFVDNALLYRYLFCESMNLCCTMWLMQ